MWLVKFSAVFHTLYKEYQNSTQPPFFSNRCAIVLLRGLTCTRHISKSPLTMGIAVIFPSPLPIRDLLVEIRTEPYACQDFIFIIWTSTGDASNFILKME